MKAFTEKYKAHVANVDLPKDHKDELIHIVYRIMESFVDAAFGTHPAQMRPSPQSQKLSDLSAEHAKITDNSTERQAVTSAEISVVRKEIP